MRGSLAALERVGRRGRRARRRRRRPRRAPEKGSTWTSSNARGRSPPRPNSAPDASDGRRGEATGGGGGGGPGRTPEAVSKARRRTAKRVRLMGTTTGAARRTRAATARSRREKDAKRTSAPFEGVDRRPPEGVELCARTPLLSPRASPPSSPPSPGFEARFMASYARHSPMKSAARASTTSTREEEEDETSKPAADARVRVLLPGRPIERSDERGPRAPNANTSDAAPKPPTTRFDVDAEDDFETFYEKYRGVFAAEAARRAEATDPSAEAATRERGRENPPRDPLSRDPPLDRSTVSTVSMRGGGSNALPGREVPDPENNPAGVLILRGAREEPRRDGGVIARKKRRRRARSTRGEGSAGVGARRRAIRGCDDRRAESSRDDDSGRVAREEGARGRDAERKNISGIL